jgi:hypothetical protein
MPPQRIPHAISAKDRDELTDALWALMNKYAVGPTTLRKLAGIAIRERARS